MQDVQNCSCSLRSVSKSKNSVCGLSFVAALPIQITLKLKTQLMCMCDLQCVGTRGGKCTINTASRTSM